MITDDHIVIDIYETKGKGFGRCLMTGRSPEFIAENFLTGAEMADLMDSGKLISETPTLKSFKVRKQTQWA